MREENLENQILEKDSKLLEIEYKVQKKDRVCLNINLFFSKLIIRLEIVFKIFINPI